MGWTRRRFLRRSAAVGAAVVSGGALLTACADVITGSPRAAGSAPRRPPSTTRAPRRATVRVVVPQGKPYAYEEGSDVTGQSVEVARAVLKNMGITRVDFVAMTFDKLITAVIAKQADLAGGVYVNRNLCQGMVFSAPDHIALTALAVPPGNPKGLKDLATAIAAGAKIAVMRDLPEQQYLTRTGAPAGQVRVEQTPDVMLQAVVAGRADCAAFNDIGLRGLIAGGLAKLDITPGFTLDGQDLLAAAYAFRQGDDLLAAFSAELTKLQQSGEWLKLAEPFGFTRENLPPPTLTAGKLCAG